MNNNEQHPNDLHQPDLHKASVVRRFKCWLGFHKWINIDTNPTPTPKDGEMICWSELYECGECGKQEYKGMGCVV